MQCRQWHKDLCWKLWQLQGGNARNTWWKFIIIIIMTDDSLVFCCRDWNPIFLLDVYWHKLSWPQLSSHQVLCNESQCFEIMEIQSWWNNYGGCQGWINDSHPSMLQWKVAATLHSSSTLFNVYGSAVLTTSQSHSREMVPPPWLRSRVAPPCSQPTNHSANTLTSTTLATSPCWYSAFEFIK